MAAISWIRPSFLAVGALLGLTLWASNAIAQKTMYRCGSVYQDRPCSDGSEGKSVAGAQPMMNSGKPGATSAAAGGASKAPAPSGGSTDIPGHCVQRGANAQKIQWAREAGLTLDQQQAKAQSGQERVLVADVYGIKGNANQVRDTIVAACARDAKLGKSTREPNPNEAIDAAVAAANARNAREDAARAAATSPQCKALAERYTALFHQRNAAPAGPEQRRLDLEMAGVREQRVAAKCG